MQQPRSHWQTEEKISEDFDSHPKKKFTKKFMFFNCKAGISKTFWLLNQEIKIFKIILCYL